MKELPAMIADMKLDLRGCEYRESQHLSHIDGFLVYYKNRGQLILSTDLTNAEKLQGVQRLLSQIEQVGSRQPRLYFWSREPLPSATSREPAASAVASPIDAPIHPTLPPALTIDHAPTRLNLAATGDQASGRIALLTLPHTFIHHAVRTITAQAVTRRAPAEDEYTLIEEETSSGHYLSLGLQAIASPRWSLVVRVVPPLQGEMHVLLNAQPFRATTTGEGTAILEGIEPALLLAAEGPDLELWIDPAPIADGAQS